MLTALIEAASAAESTFSVSVPLIGAEPPAAAGRRSAATDMLAIRQESRNNGRKKKEHVERAQITHVSGEQSKKTYVHTRPTLVRVCTVCGETMHGS